MPKLPRLRRLLRLSHGLARDLVQAMRVLREVERARWVEGPAVLVARLRRRGMKGEARSPEGRRRLLRLIRLLDRWLMPEPNCYRRALANVALDPVSAAEPFVLGLDLPGTQARGHAWVEGTDEGGGRFDVEFRL
jgi:hypothetical protein